VMSTRYIAALLMSASSSTLLGVRSGRPDRATYFLALGSPW
jgi:hypothetical protein